MSHAAHLRTGLLAGTTAVATAGVLALPLTVASAAPPAHAGAPLSADLTGAAEVPGPGDPDGTGAAPFRLNPGRGTICYTLEVTGIDPATAAHIHVGDVDEAGPVVVPLLPPTSGTSSACVDVERDLIRNILRDPDEYYVNVHNAPYPAGALRGQLSRR